MRRGERAVLSTSAWAEQGFAVEQWFAPGEYSLDVTNEGLHGSARFTVGNEPGTPIVVQLR